ncbi:MAG: HdeD family acid-resistance protein [Methylocella sp.]
MRFFGEKPDFDISLSSTLAHNWTVVVARGVFGLIIGLIAFLFPGPTLLSLVGLFAVFLIIDGILAIVAAVRAASKNERWGFLTFEGIAGIVAGILAMAMPGLTIFVFVGLLAAWALVSGALELRAAFKLATDHGRWWLALGGIISIVFGIVLVAAPRFGAVVVSWWVGAYATFFGASLLVLGFKLRARSAGTRTQGGTRRA